MEARKINIGKDIHENVDRNGRNKAASITNTYALRRPLLSQREQELLLLIADEYTMNEIAKKLFIALGTVETHRRNILRKLGARNTAGMIRRAMEQNII